MDLDAKIRELEKLDLSKYEQIKTEKLDDIQSAGLMLKHKKSGARVVILANEDENKVFSVGFKTPPYDDTGVAHILEHSTLCGSRKYPVKDPFVELCKGSLNTFLNAMTYPDKTVYPVASCNLADFKNIIDVYMDAVFYPDIYRKPQIFRQEGWHYELDDPDDVPVYNGVVFNEMKGVYSSPEDVLFRHIFESLFPDTAYRFESGGEPSSIPDLTYEAFLDYHRKYYHPSNSYIYLYGDFDVQERLDYLDREYLSDFERRDDIDSSVALQPPFTQIADETHCYAVTDDEPLEKNTYLSFNRVAGTSLDRKLYVAMQVLDYVLVMAPGAKLKQALIDKKIGTDIYSSLESSVYQPLYSIIAKNADASDKEAFLSTIQEVLSDIVKNGIDMRMVEAGINYFEFKYREADYGSYPKGLIYYLTMMDSWLYDENEPFMHIKAGEIFEQLKREKDEGLFEKLIQEYLLDNLHGSVVTLAPERGLEEKAAQKEQARLEAYAKQLDRAGREKLAEETKALRQYQEEPSSQEALKSIPMLKLDDIDPEPQKLYNEPKSVAGIPVIHHSMFTNKIAYIMLAFDCRNVPEELLPYLGVLSATLGLMDTENYTYPELTNEINANSGGISTDAAIYSDNKDFSKYTIMYEAKGKVLYEKIPFVLKMLHEILYKTKFDDYKRLREIIARVKSRMESMMLSSGQAIATLSGLAQFSPAGYYSDLMRGYGYYQLVRRLDSGFDSLKESISSSLRRLAGYIFTSGNLTVSFCGDENGYERFVPAMEDFAGRLEKTEMQPAAPRSYTPYNLALAYTSSSQVQYVARCGNFVDAGYEYTGALKVLKVIFSYDYLWTNVRVKGGAYGCMSGFNKNGDMYMVSYRDPNLRKTNEVYEGAAAYIRSFDASSRDMLKYIIGTIGELDMPLNPYAKAIRSFGAYICRLDYEDMKKERDEILNATTESIRALAPLVEAAVGQRHLCVVGNQKTIQEETGMFDRIEPLLAQE